MHDNEVFRKEIANSMLTESIAVQAGPGSGKTTLLIERLKYIIKNRNNSLSGIACITYTNTAKDEIIERLQTEGMQFPPELFIGTIHSFLLEHVINPYSYLAHKEKKPYKLATVGYARGHKQKIGELLNRQVHFINESICKSFESLGRDEEGNPYCYRNKISTEVARAWKIYMRDNGYIDQQDVIYLSYLILNKYKHIRKAFSLRFPYILVDEYQDVTFFQEQIFSLLERTSFFCVGDFNQSIFSFTGAKPEVFQAKWNNECYKKYTLTNNFRSTEYIVQFANLKTEIVQGGIGSNGMSEQKVVFIKEVGSPGEAIELFHHLRKSIECEKQYKPFMILARQNKYIEALNDLMKDKEVSVNQFLNKLRELHYRCYRILENTLLAILYKRRNEFDKAVAKMAEAFSYLFFNNPPNYISLADIGYDAFMWRKLQIFTLQYLDSLVLTETSVADLFLKVKQFVSEQSKTLYGKAIGKKIVILNYKWSGQKKASQTTLLSQLIEQLEFRENLSGNEGHTLSIHSAKGQEAESVLVMAESEAQLMEWLGENEESEEARIGYVAFSRARKLLCVWAPKIQEVEYIHLESHVEFRSMIQTETTDITSIL